MKTIVKLAVILATLLLLTGAVSASCPDLRCYEISWTHLDSGDTGSSVMQICFNYGSQTGTFTYMCGGGNLSLFFDMPSLTDKALAYNYDAVGYLTFHGDFEDFAGIFDCTSGNNRFKVKGTEVNCEE